MRNEEKGRRKEREKKEKREGKKKRKEEIREKNMIQSYKDLIVWQKSMDLVIEIYKLTEKFPKTEIYGLTSQMRRSVISIPSNIAEGRKNSSKKDFRHFLSIAYGSCSELETQIEISKRLFIIEKMNYNKIDELLNEIIRMLGTLMMKLKS